MSLTRDGSWAMLGVSVQRCTSAFVPGPRGDSAGEEAWGEAVTLRCAVSASQFVERSGVTMMVKKDRVGGRMWLAVALALWVLSPMARAETLLVPDEYPTIQAAIDAAVDGDVVELADGVYTGEGNKNLDYGGKNITVRSASGDPTQCIIDCEHDGRGFYFHSGEGPSATVEGLTIRNGLARFADEPHSQDGGAVYCTESGPTMQSCIVEQCEAYTGGAVYAVDASPVMLNCRLSGNQSTNWHGGALALEGCQLLIEHCVLESNRSSRRGAAILISESTATITDCDFVSNEAEGNGGAIAIARSDVVIERCTFVGNAAEYGGALSCGAESVVNASDCSFEQNSSTGYWGRAGGAIYATGSQGTYERCRFIRNVSSSYGGAIAQYESDRSSFFRCEFAENFTGGSGGALYADYTSFPELENCLLVANKADEGAGVHCDGAPAVLVHCTLTGNVAEDEGGAVHAHYCPDARLDACILWANEPDEIHADGTPPVVVNSCVRGGWAGDSNIDLDPGFAFERDPHLTPGSPCIDALDWPVSDAETDLDGNSRTIDGDEDGADGPDMGAFEYNPHEPSIALSEERLLAHALPEADPVVSVVLRIRSVGSELHWTAQNSVDWLTVSPDSGVSDGAINDVELIMDRTSLEPGIHEATVTFDDPLAVNGPRSIEVTLVVGRIIQVPADYDSIGEALDAALDGDIIELADGVHGGAGNRDLVVGGRSITIRSASGDPEQCIIDCEEQGTCLRFRYNEGPDTVVEGVTITNAYGNSNYAGGAIAIRDASPTIRNCIFSFNADDMGAGIGLLRSNSIITDCIFLYNAAVSGGGLYVEDAEVTVSKCFFYGNSARDGGGAYIDSGASTIRASTFERNFAYLRGGGACVEAEEGRIDACNFNQNTSEEEAGGLWLKGVMSNCIVVGNEATYGGGVVGAWQASITTSLIERNSAQKGAAVYVVQHGHPMIQACTIANHNDAIAAVETLPGAEIRLIGSILWNETVSEIKVFYPSDATVSYCDVRGGYAGLGNINIDPMFMDPDGPDDNPATWEDNDYRLAAGSHCIDAGDNTALPSDFFDLDGDGDVSEPVPLDLSGMPRFLDDPWVQDTGNGEAPVVDMGALERQADPSCHGDLDDDNDTDLADLGALLAAYEIDDGGDLDGDGDTDLSDLGILLADWGCGV